MLGNKFQFKCSLCHEKEYCRMLLFINRWYEHFVFILVDMNVMHTKQISLQNIAYCLGYVLSICLVWEKLGLLFLSKTYYLFCLLGCNVHLGYAFLNNNVQVSFSEDSLGCIWLLAEIIRKLIKVGVFVGLAIIKNNCRGTWVFSYILLDLIAQDVHLCFLFQPKI